MAVGQSHTLQEIDLPFLIFGIASGPRDSDPADLLEDSHSGDSLAPASGVRTCPASANIFEKKSGMEEL